MRRLRPKKLSPGEETLALQLRTYGIQFTREYRFAPPRLWRADFALLEHKLLIEVEGGTWSGGRHTRGSGFEEDCDKYNAATMQGWRVLRYSTGMVYSGKAIDDVVSVTGASASIGLPV